MPLPVILKVWSQTEQLHQNHLGALTGFLGPTPTESESLGVRQRPIKVWESVVVHCTKPGLYVSPSNNILWPTMYPQSPQIFRDLDLHPHKRADLDLPKVFSFCGVYPRPVLLLLLSRHSATLLAGSNPTCPAWDSSINTVPEAHTFLPCLFDNKYFLSICSYPKKW